MKHNSASRVRFNIMDFVIILFVVLCVAALAVRYYYTNMINSDFVEVRVSFIVPSVMESTAASMKAGKTVYMSSGDTEAGIIESVEISPSEIYASDENGNNLKKVEHPYLKDIKGTLVVKGKWTEKGFMLNGTVLVAMSDNVVLYSEDIEFMITVTGITSNEQNF